MKQDLLETGMAARDADTAGPHVADPIPGADDGMPDPGSLPAFMRTTAAAGHIPEAAGRTEEA
jgi:hypothetical protein